MMNQYKRLGIFRAVVFMIICVVLMLNKYNSFQADNDDKSKQELNQLTSYYKLFFDDKLDKLHLISNDDKVVRYFEEVKTDIEIETHYNYNYVHQSIIDLQQGDSDIDYAFVASNHVNSFLSEPYFDAPDYVASDRVWFKETVATDDDYLTQIYIDPFTDMSMITMSTPIESNEIHGVVAVDVNMSQIVDYVSSNGKTLIIQNGEIYDYMTLSDSYDLQTIDALVGIDDMTEGTHKVMYKGKDYNMFVKKDVNTGHYLALLEEPVEQNKMIVSSLLQTFAVFFILSILSVIVGIAKDNKIRRNQYKEEV